MPQLRSTICNSKERYLDETKQNRLLQWFCPEDLDVGISIAQTRPALDMARRTGATNHPAQAMMLARAKLKIVNI